MDNHHFISGLFCSRRAAIRSSLPLTPLVVLLLLLSHCAAAQVAIGEWRDHFSYENAKRVDFGNGRVYAAYNNAVGYYDIDEDAVWRMSKCNKKLSDVGVSTIAYDSTTRSLVVAYGNANIDIVQDDRLYNVGDLKRSTMAGNKQIYDIAFYKKHAYLATGAGLVIVDLVRHEIETSCQITTDEVSSAVYAVAIDGSTIYAATADGLYTIDRDNRFPNISDRWQRDVTSLLAGRTIRQLQLNGDALLALVQEEGSTYSLFRRSSGGDYIPVAGGEIISVRCRYGYTAVTYYDHVDVYDASYELAYSRDKFTWGDMQLNDAVCDKGGALWVGHTWAGLIKFDSKGRDKTYNPEGLSSDNVYSITAFNDKTYICPGGKTTTNTNLEIQNSICYYDKNGWHNIDNRSGRKIYDYLQVAVNPTNPSQMAAASWGNGIALIEDDVVTALYDDSNSNGAIVALTMEGWRHVRTAAVAFDREGTLWATNSLAVNALVERRSDGSWHSYETQSMVGDNEVDKLVCDSVTGYKWFCGRSNRIFVHDGRSRKAYVNANNGSRLETGRINCMTQDRSGDIWIGTDKGIKIIFDGHRAFANGGNGELSPVNCSNIVISNGEFVEYLMAYEEVTCIAVDGANRKWVGTATGGVYLLSATGLEELQHFTADNSPLPSNKIVYICVQPRSGEVFIGTDYGIVGYRSTSTYGTTLTSGNAYAFPNPVRPDYEGPIAVKNLTNNALIHITDAAGHVVFTTTADGGQAIWNGRTNSGERVAGGVYYVFASDSEGGNRSVAKILVIR